MAMAMQVGVPQYVGIFSYQEAAPDIIEMDIAEIIEEVHSSVLQPTPIAVVLEEPVSSFRYRYKTEKGAHGCLLGVNNGTPTGGNGSPNGTRKKSKNDPKVPKSYPKVSIQNYSGPVTLRVSLATSNDPGSFKKHVHEFHHNNTKLEDGTYTTSVNIEMENQVIELQGLHICHIGKKNENIYKVLYDRLIKQQNENINEFLHFENGINQQQIETQATAETEVMKNCMNSASLCIEFFDEHMTHLLCRTFSTMINNEKTAAALKITQMSACGGSPRGNEQMIILCEKVNKDDIKVRFHKDDWVGFGEFTPIGVWHQYAIEFRTPPYKELNIENDVIVEVQLVKKDGSASEPKNFTYQSRIDERHVDRKRQRTEFPKDESFTQFTQQTLGEPGPAYQPFQFDHPSTFKQECSSLQKKLAPFYPALGLHLDVTAVPYPSDLQEPSSAQIIEEIAELEMPDTFFLRNRDPMLSQANTVEELEQYLLHSSSDIVPDSPIEADAKPVRSQSRLIPRSSVSGGSLPNKLFPADSIARKKELVDKVVCNKTASGYRLAYDLAVKMAEQLQIYAKTSEVKYLLKSMCHLISIQDDNGDNVIHNAVIHANEESSALYNLVEVLDNAQDSPINMFNNLVQTPLHIAIHVNNSKMVQVLIEHGANSNLLDRHGNSALHLANHHGKDELVKILLNKDLYKKAPQEENFPNLNQLNYNGYSPLHLAVQAKSLACVRLLCEAGADINVEDGTSGRSAIYTAVEFKDEEILRELLNQQSANVNAQTFSGYTPLHLACSAKSTELVRLLVDAKADPTIEGTDEIGDEESSDEDNTCADGEENGKDDFDECRGYNSFDLASDNKEILQMLRSAVRKSLTVAEVSVEPKLISSQETSKKLSLGHPESSAQYDDSGLIDDYDDDSEFNYKPEEHTGSSIEMDKHSMGDSGLGFQTSELDDMNKELKETIASILDQPGPSNWKSLAKQLDLDCMNAILGSAKSPTIALLSYIPSVKALYDGLDAIGSKIVVNIIKDYYESQSSSDIESSIQKMKKLSLK